MSRLVVIIRRNGMPALGLGLRERCCVARHRARAKGRGHGAGVRRGRGRGLAPDRRGGSGHPRGDRSRSVGGGRVLSAIRGRGRGETDGVGIVRRLLVVAVLVNICGEVGRDIVISARIRSRGDGGRHADGGGIIGAGTVFVCGKLIEVEAVHVLELELGFLALDVEVGCVGLEVDEEGLKGSE